MLKTRVCQRHRWHHKLIFLKFPSIAHALFLI